MTYDQDNEKQLILDAIKEKILINRILNIPDEKRKRICIWGQLKK